MVLGVLGVYDICCVCGLPPHRVLGEIFAPQQSRLRLRILLLAAAGAALLYLRVRMMGGQQPIVSRGLYFVYVFAAIPECSHPNIYPPPSPKTIV